MKNSSGDFVALVGEVNRRMARVVGELKTRRGMINAGPEIVKCMKTARRVYNRMAKGDLRHTDSEAGQVCRLANWCVEQHSLMRGQEFKPVAFDTAQFVKKNT